MRGIPRQAAHAHGRIKGTEVLACDVADPSNICEWNPDMYGVRPGLEASQKYYDSLMELYAEWGVDFIKCDDICRMDRESARQEIVMLQEAIQRCGRPIVLSLSPGPAKIEEAWLYEKYANMWRITDDFWDKWELLKPMFWRCELWQSHVGKGCFPDCDMLPLGKLGKGFGHEWETNFTRDEQITMMTLWCIFRSPLMIGTDLPQMDDHTKSLLTNKDVLRLLKFSAGARQIERDEERAIWCSLDSEEDVGYLAVFNLEDGEKEVDIPWDAVAGYGISGREGKELWSGKAVTLHSSVTVPAHGAKLYRLAI